MSAGFHALSAAWLFALMAPVVLFYFLKLKRPRLEVPSLVLWRRVLEDSRVNSPFQRFKRNVLLLLQLMILALIALAAMQPYWRGKEAKVRRLPVLVDCSASMGALDKPGGVSRLDAAKAEVTKLIEGMLPGEELCLVSFGRTARRRSPFTDNARVLREALAGIEVEDVQSELEDALRLAQALSRTVSFDEVLLLSDGNLPEDVQVDLPFTLTFRKLPAAGPNAGLTALNARRNAEGGWDVFILAEASGETEAEAVIEVRGKRGPRAEGERIAREHVSLAGAAAQRMVVRVPGGEPTRLDVTLSPAGFDSLRSDDFAFLDLPAARPLAVYCPADMVAFRHALDGMKGLTVDTGEASTGRASSHDLVISDRKEDAELDARARLFVGFVPEDLKELVTTDQAAEEVVDWRRDHALLRHVELADLALLDRARSAEGVLETDYEQAGYEVLVHGRGGPLLLEKRGGGRLAFHALFHPDRSTLPYRVAFPILLANLVDIGFREGKLAEARAARTGVLECVEVAPSTGCKVETPDGGTLEDTSDADGLLAGIAAPRAGRYVIRCGGTTRSVGASLLSPSETSLASVDTVGFKELTVAASAGPLKTDRPFWYPLAALAFLVALGEWWLYNRRP